MYKLCKTEQSAARQRELEQGLLKALGEHKYEDISISDLCQFLDIPRKSFYRYFSGKEGALHGLIDHTLMEFEGFSGKGDGRKNRSVEKDLESFFTFWLNHRLFLDVIQKNDLGGILLERSVELSLSEGGMPKRFLSQHDAEKWNYVTMFGICGLMSLVFSWHQEGFRQSPRQMARIAAELMTKPLFSQEYP